MVSLVQFKIVSMRSEKPTCVPACLSDFSPTLNLKQSNVRLTDEGPISSFQGRLLSASSLHASLLLVFDVVMSLAQAPQHFKSSESWLSLTGR